MSKGGRPKTVEYDPYIEILLTHGLKSDGTRGFESISHACQDRGIARERIYSASRRGVKDIKVMADLAVLFGIPKNLFLAHIVQYADEIYDSHIVSSKAS